MLQKLTLTVEIDIPDGWEAYAIRSPKHGEWFLNDYGELVRAHCDWLPKSVRVILRRTYTAPKWIKSEWTLRKRDDGAWVRDDPSPPNLSYSMDGLDFDPPPYSPFLVQHEKGDA